jgi:hypothetical protein
MPIDFIVSPPVEHDESLVWKKLDIYGAFVGELSGTIGGLRETLLGGGFLGRPLADVSRVTVAHNQRLYLCDPQVLVECTVVKLTTPWGEERYIPADAFVAPPSAAAGG